jgi:hypothetical protein
MAICEVKQISFSDACVLESTVAASQKCCFYLKNKKIFFLFYLFRKQLITQADKDGHLEVSRSRPWLQEHSKLPEFINLIII